MIKVTHLPFASLEISSFKVAKVRLSSCSPMKWFYGLWVILCLHLVLEINVEVTSHHRFTNWLTHPYFLLFVGLKFVSWAEVDCSFLIYKLYLSLCSEVSVY